MNNASPDRRTLKSIIWLVGILLFTGVLYWPVMVNPLISEDHTDQILARNHSPSYFLFRSYYGVEHGGLYYRPMARGIDHLIINLTGGGEINPYAQHVVQLSMHGVCVVLLFLLILQFTNGSTLPAGLACLLFAIHPASSPAVAHLSVRWSMSACLLFLALANLYYWVLRPGREDPPRVALILLPFGVFFLALIAEIGALEMGVLGLWVLYECIRRRSWRWAAWSLLPLVWVPIAYLIMRHVAVGSGSEYVKIDPKGPDAFLLGVWNFTVDLSILLNPFIPKLFGLDRIEESVLNLLGLVGLSLVILPFVAFPRSRQQLKRIPLPLFALLSFAVLQAASLWRLPRLALAQAGFDRGYLYYFPLAMVCALMGWWLRELLTKRHLWNRVLVAAFVVAMVPVVDRTHQCVNLWVQAGKIISEHRNQLEPFLKQLPENSQVHMKDFPLKLRQPYLSWAYLYDYAQRPTMEYWAGKKLSVTSDFSQGAPPSGFDGWILEAKEYKINVQRVSANASHQKYLERQKARTSPAPDLRLFESTNPSAPLGTNAGGGGLLSVTRQNGVLTLNANDPDPFIYVGLDINPLDYGVLEYDVRLKELAPSVKEVMSQVFFRTAQTFETEFCSVKTKLNPASRDWQHVRFDLSKTQSWVESEMIRILRFDLTDCPGVIELKNVRLTNEPVAGTQP